jgi:hypothetical protein
LREVEDAMIAANTYEEEYKIKSAQVEAAQSAADLSWVRYEGAGLLNRIPRISPRIIRRKTDQAVG